MTIEPITGNEPIEDIQSPFAALVQFYAAFNGQNLAGMRSNWIQNDEAAMSNPLGGIKRGWADIETTYQKIFFGPAIVTVQFYDYTITSTENMFVAVGRERGSLEIGDTRINLLIRTSRIYRREQSLWKQVHHHGSMDDPTLLTQYQNIVLKA